MNAKTEPTALDPRQILNVLVRRKVLLIAPWGGALAIGLVAAFLLPPVYSSSVHMFLQRPQALDNGIGAMGGGPRPELMRDQLSSTTFLRGVVTASGLKSDPLTRVEALKHAAEHPGETTEGGKIEAYLVDQLRQEVSVKLGKGDVFQLIVEDRRPDRARRLVAAVADQFVNISKAAQIAAVGAVQEFSSAQQQVYKEKVEASEARLDSVRRSLLTSTLTGSSVTEGNLARVRALLDQANMDLDEQRQRVNTLKQQLGGTTRQFDPARLTSPETQNLVAQIVGLERQAAAEIVIGADGGAGGSARTSSARKTAELEIQFTQNAALAFPSATPEIRDALVRYRLADVDMQARDARRAYLASQVGSYEQRVVMTPDREALLARLQQEVESNRAFYNTFLQQSAAAQIAQAFENAKVSGRFVVLDPADLPRVPSKPNRPMLIVLAFVLGGIIGVSLVLVVEQHDQSMKNAEEVETLLGLPVVGAIPRVEELERSRRRGRSRPTAATAAELHDAGLLHRLRIESPLGLEFRRIFLKLAKTRGRTLPSTLLLTSSTRGEGKTTITACLAITLARELDEKILLVDFDLRSPALHRALGLPSSSWGLAQMLAQNKFDERFIRSTVLPRLDFLAAGRSERPTSELVDTESVEWFVREAHSRYPVVVMDSAPNLAVPDPLIIGRAVEAVLYVIKAGATVRKAAEYGVKVQREARDNILGVLLNDAGEILPHYYGYRDAYGYSPEAAGGES